MKCKEIHNDEYGCGEYISENVRWRYCPNCGKPLGHITLECTDFEVSETFPSTKSATFYNNGLTDVRVNLQINHQFIQNVRLRSSSVNVPARGTAQFALEIPPIMRNGNLVTIEFKSNDDYVTDYSVDPWHKREERRELKVFKAKVKKKAKISLIQEAVFFRNNMTEREVSIINTGDECAEIIAIDCPEGYLCSEMLGIINGGEKRTFIVNLESNGQQPAEISELSFWMNDNSCHTAQLHFTRSGGAQAVHRAVVGIDFGTAYTSVSFRRCNNNPNIDDKVEFLHPEGNDKNRFRTRVWINKLTHEMAYYEEDVSTFFENLTSSGFLLREVKTMLRYDILNENEIKQGTEEYSRFIEPGDKREEAKRILFSHLSIEWPIVIVTNYLRWIYNNLIAPKIDREFNSNDVRVKYVFTIPVLDYAESQIEYNKYKQRLERCIIEAGYLEGSYEFQFEPVCAALGLIHPFNNSWPKLGTIKSPIKKGDQVMVFDSGGGTSDAALASVDFDETGKTILRIEGCLGVGSNFETFGGEKVTDMLISAISDPFPDEERSRYANIIRASDHDEGLLRDIEYNLGLKDNDNGESYYDDNDNIDVGTEVELNIRDNVEVKIKIPLASNSNNDAVFGKMIINKNIFDMFIYPHLNSMGSELKSRIFTNTLPQNVRYYLCVGGNSKIESVEKWVAKFMVDSGNENSSRRLQIPKDERDIAVAYGAVWVPDSRVKNQLLYDIEITFHNMVDEISIFKINRNTAQETIRKIEEIKMEINNEGVIVVKTILNNITKNLTSFKVINSFDSDVMMQIIVDIQNGKLNISKNIRPDTEQEYGGEEPVLEYRI